MKLHKELSGSFACCAMCTGIVLLFSSLSLAESKDLKSGSESIKAPSELSPSRMTKQRPSLVPPTEKAAPSKPTGEQLTPAKATAPSGGSVAPRSATPASAAKPSEKPSSQTASPSSIKSIAPVRSTQTPETRAEIKSIFQSSSPRNDLREAGNRNPFPEPIPGEGPGNAPAADGFNPDSIPGGQAGNDREDIFRPTPFEGGRTLPDKFTGIGRGDQQGEQFVPGQNDPERDQHQQEQRIRTGKTVDRTSPFPDDPHGGPDKQGLNVPDQGKAAAPGAPAAPPAKLPPPPPPDDDPDESAVAFPDQGKAAAPGVPARPPSPPYPPGDDPDDPDESAVASPAGAALDLSRAAHARSPAIGDEGGPGDPRASASDGTVALPGLGEAASPAIGDEGGRGGSIPDPKR